MQIFASWTKSTLYPGETNTLSITSAYNNSLCAISAIDEASTYLKASNPMDIEQMWTHWNRDSHYIDESLNCNMPEHHIHTYEEMQLQLGSPSSFGNAFLNYNGTLTYNNDRSHFKKYIYIFFYKYFQKLRKCGFFAIDRTVSRKMILLLLIK